MCCNDLCVVLRQWRARGDIIVFMIDANKNIKDNMLSRTLAAEDITLKEAVRSVSPGHGPITHFRGTELIEGIWYTPDMELRGTDYLPFDVDMRDYWPVLTNFTQTLLLGVNLPHIVQPAARRLNSQVDRIRDKYNKDLKYKFRQGQFFEWLKNIGQEQFYLISRQAKEALEKIDHEMTDLMLSTEKGCSQMYANHYYSVLQSSCGLIGAMHIGF